MLFGLLAELLNRKNKPMKIGVFDSGVGGLSVARAIERALPQHEVLFVNDAEHLPYGSKSPEELLGYVIPILSDLAANGVEVIVIACNTVSTTLITELRSKLSVPLVAIEPMVKPAAAMTKSKTIAVCATPTTLASKRYAWLKESYAGGIRVVEPDTSEWALMIERKQFSELKIAESIEAVLAAGADVIVLACTHYHWIEDLIVDIAGDRATIIQPEQATIRQLVRVIKGIVD
jgi:glutamate racemase